jgi:hypothetical protein
MVALLVIGAVAVSWPPFYARLPGPYIVGGRDRTVDQYDLEAADWADLNLNHGSVVAADITNSELMASIGQETIPGGFTAAFLLMSTSVSPALEKEVIDANIQFVVADQRITTAVAVAGNPVFQYDPFAGYYVRPIPTRSLGKFNSLAGVSRVFDDGPIVIFDLRGSRYNAGVAGG